MTAPQIPPLPAGLPATAFVAPDGSNRAAVVAHAGRLLEWLIDCLSGAGGRPPLPAVLGAPDALPQELMPLAPSSEADMMADLERLVAGSMNPASPGWIGHMDPVPATAGILGEMVSAALNNNMLSLEMGPAFVGLERAMLEAQARLFGLPEGAGGVMASGGSLANLQALAVARNQALPNIREDGLMGETARPLILASEVAHTSLQKAAMVLGLGARAVVPVAADEAGRMDAGALADAIAGARRDGANPFCVVATAGTTVIGAIDPLEAIAEVARREGLWLHVDAAYGGAMVFSARWRANLAGIEAADSITFNPQKWLYVPKTCAMTLFRDAQSLADHFRIAAPYMADTGGLVNPGEVSIHGTRHAEVLKYWLVLRHLGRSGLEALIDAGMARAAHLQALVTARPWLQSAGAPDTNIVCFRAAPPGGGDLDALNAGLQRHLLEDAETFLSLPVWRGGRWLRCVLLNPYTGIDHLDALLARLDAFAANEGWVSGAG